MFSIFDMPAMDRVRIRIIDAGAMTVGEEVYASLTKRGRADVLGFEAVAEECAKLSAGADSNHRYLPYAVADGRRRTLHVCALPMTSSLYEPNRDLLDLYQALGDLVQVTSRIEMDTVRLDDIPEAHGADLLKMDVQGAELDILAGAKEVLKEVLVVHAEVEFVPLYKDQPLFGDVDRELRNSGFYFHRFTAITGRALKPMLRDNDPLKQMGQMLWADAVYVRPPDRLHELNALKLLKLAALMHDVYAAPDYACRVLQHYDRQCGTCLWQSYFELLRKG